VVKFEIKHLNNFKIISNNFITRKWLRYVRVFAIANPSVVCRLSTFCNVRAPYSGDWSFRQYFSPPCTLASSDLSAKFYGGRPRGTLPSDAL